MVATNLDHDTEKYLSRFVQGLDYPIKHKLVVWGGCDPMVADEVCECVPVLPCCAPVACGRPQVCQVEHWRSCCCCWQPTRPVCTSLLIRTHPRLHLLTYRWTG